MTDDISKVAVGGMLHDIGKILYRYNDGRNHSISGYDYLKENVEGLSTEILEQIKFHHGKLLKQANIPNDSLAYITYIADNIAAMADRRTKNEEGIGFARDLPLESIFNILNGNQQKFCYPQSDLSGNEIVYPSREVAKYQESIYGACLRNILDCIKGIELKSEYINSLLEVLEANMSFVPSSTSNSEIADISLFDHSKITAAIGCCIYQYLEEQEIYNYKEILFEQCQKFYKENAFLVYSLDISGIQDFIYTIQSESALKGLRARSFYLELIMEHIVDELLDKLTLARTNLLYVGGGHAYFILPNTKNCLHTIEKYEREINHWFLENFDTALYIAGGYSICCANAFNNKPEGSYTAIFNEISNQVSKKKMMRYTREEIILLNNMDKGDTERECKICHRVGKLEDEKCPICFGLEKFSKLIQEKEFFLVMSEKTNDTILPLPKGKYLEVDKEKNVKKKMLYNYYVRSYCKNKMYTGLGISSKVWVGDYQKGRSFKELADGSRGIKRLGVLRADIDNLGQAFVSGFDKKYVSLSRTATFSRKLSSFFKQKINYILENGEYYLHEDELVDTGRNATIVYSGGDDLFIIGAWDDVVGLAIDINESLKEYSQNTLTISAGIGIYPEKYPVVTMARQTGFLEDMSKGVVGKNAVTLFEEDLTYKWDELVDEVIESKYRLIYDFFENFPEFGKAFLYKIVDYMRQREERINLARFAYLLARMEPKEDKNMIYQDFAKNMYDWIRDKKQCQQAIMAIYLYVYMTREREDK